MMSMGSNSIKYIIIPLVIIVAILCVYDKSYGDDREYYNSGIGYLKAGKIDEARIEFLNAIKFNPRNAEAHYQLVNIYMNRRNFKLAYKHLLNVVALKPEMVQAQINAAQLEFLSGLTVAAEERIENVLKKHPENVDALCLMGQLQAKRKNSEKALEFLHSALKIDPNRINIYILLGSQYAELENKNEAEKYFIKAVNVDPKSTIANLVLTKYYVSNGDYNAAVGALKQAIKRNQGELVYQDLLVQLMVETQTGEEAENYIKKLVNDNPKNQVYLLSLARMYALRGDEQSSKNIFEKSIQLFQNDILPYISYSKYLKDIHQPKEALKVLNAAPEDGRKTSIFQIALAECEMVLGQNEIALKRIEKIGEEYPDNLDIKRLMGQLYFRMKRYRDAIAIYSELLGKYPNDSYAFLLRAMVYLATQKEDLATKDLFKSVQLDKRNIAATLLLAKVLFQSGDMSLAERYLNDAHSMFPNNHKILEERGSLYLKKGELDKAYIDLLQAIKLNPKSALTQYQMGLYYLSQRESSSAKVYFDKALELESKHIPSLKGNAEILEMENRPSEAIEYLKRCVGKVDNESAIYALIGDVYLRHNNVNEAEKYYLKATSIKDSTISAWLGLGKIYWKRNDFENASKIYKMALNANDQNVILMVNLGQTFEKLDRPDLAIEYYRKALTIRDNYVPALNNLAYSYAENGTESQLNEALRLINMAKKIVGNDPRILDTLGWILYKKKDYSAALEEFMAIGKRGDTNPIIQYHIALTLYALNRKEEALNTLIKTEVNAIKDIDLKNILLLKGKIQKDLKNGR